ncbi:hypothetical protein [Salinispora arenicola]|uniref:hypothetical protein n=1 Tax=Salinispora arenicola TaxID=168697 RepID=UPI0018AD5A7B|nr:hypothetical protein [Salinispora arenicola]
MMVADEFSGVGRPADGGAFAEPEDGGQVQRVGAAVTASSSCQSIRSRSRVPGRPRRFRIQVALTGARPMALAEGTWRSIASSREMWLIALYFARFMATLQPAPAAVKGLTPSVWGGVQVEPTGHHVGAGAAA